MTVVKSSHFGFRQLKAEFWLWHFIDSLLGQRVLGNVRLGWVIVEVVKVRGV